MYLNKNSENFFDEKNAKITKRSHAFKDYASSSNVQILSSFNLELQLKEFEFAVKNKLINFLTKLKGFKFVTALVLEFKKIKCDDKTKCDTFYLKSKPETIINESDIGDVFQSSYTTIISNIQKSSGKGSRSITDSVIDHNINISKYNLLAGSSCIKLSRELDCPRKVLINIQHFDDNECFRWC